MASWSLPKIPLDGPGRGLLIDDNNEALELGIPHDVAQRCRWLQASHIRFGEFSRLDVGFHFPHRFRTEYQLISDYPI